MEYLTGDRPVNDIREYKKDLRTRYRKLRTDMSPEEKADRDGKILQRILSSGQYENAQIILTYVSTDIEVDTRELILQSISRKKRVAVPGCIDGVRYVRVQAGLWKRLL